MDIRFPKLDDRLSMRKSRSKSARASSKNMPGPPRLRYYAAHRLAAWQPIGTLDDKLLDHIMDWLLIVEKVALPLKRFVDLSRLTTISLQAAHVFKFSRKRIATYSARRPVRSAVFCETEVGFSIARLYETLMEESPIKVRAFRERADAARWLKVPANILSLTDEPVPWFK